MPHNDEGVVKTAVFANAIMDISSIRDSMLIKLAEVAPRLIGALVIFIVGWVVIRVLTKIVEHFFERVDFERSAETFVENSATRSHLSDTLSRIRPRPVIRPRSLHLAPNAVCHACDCQGELD